MRSGFLIGVIALGSLAGSSFGQGQHAASPGMAAAPVAHTAPISNSASRPAANHHNAVAVGRSPMPKPTSRDIDALGASTMAPRFVGPVSPGGFVNPLGGTGGGRRHQKKNATNELLIFGGGFGYVPDDSQFTADDPAQGEDETDSQKSGGQQESQYATIQQTPSVRQQPQQVANDNDAAPDEESRAIPPLPDVGSFTLVTRGGYRLDAVAFTRSNDRLVYITPDGGRRTIAMRDLDVDSTQRLNQELGTPIEIPSDSGSVAKPNPSGEGTN